MRASFKSLLAISMAVAAALPAPAAPAMRPAQPVSPAGVPRGAHYDLTIVGTEGGFACPAQEYLADDFGNHVLDSNGDPVPAYGNVVFAPESGDGVMILMLKIAPGLESAQDEFGNDLVYLGLVTDQGFQTLSEELLSGPKESSVSSRSVNPTALQEDLAARHLDDAGGKADRGPQLGGDRREGDEEQQDHDRRR